MFKSKIVKVANLNPVRGEKDCSPGILVQEKDDKGKPFGPTMIVVQIAGQDVLVNYKE